jgi:hypothetical protein
VRFKPTQPAPTTRPTVKLHSPASTIWPTVILLPPQRASRKHFEAKFVEQQKQIESLATIVQKVSAQLEQNKAAPQLVADNQ